MYSIRWLVDGSVDHTVVGDLDSVFAIYHMLAVKSRHSFTEISGIHIYHCPTALEINPLTAEPFIYEKMAQDVAEAHKLP